MRAPSRALAIGLLVVVGACDPSGPDEPELAITSITPAVLEPGVTATIHGTGFATLPGNNAVTIAGAPLQVATATATELTVELTAAAFPCAAGGSAVVAVTVDTKSDSVDHPITGPAEHALAVGDQLVLHSDQARCIELTQGGRYFVSVFNTSTSASSTSAFRLRGAGAAGTVAAPAVAADVATTPLHQTTPLRSDLPDPADADHHWLLERNLELARRLPPLSVARETTGARSVAAEPVPQLGDLRTLRIPDLDASNLCLSYVEVEAKVVYTGAKGVIFEDVQAPLAGQMDARWQQVGQEFDDVMYQVIIDNFGDPLILDSQLDDNGRLFMLYSEVVNDFERSVAGFVFSGDLVPRTSCSSSDTAEIFYGMVPTSAVSGFPTTGDRNTIDRWHWSMRSTVIHEVKHITSFAVRRAASRPLEETWLEEATARLAEELYSRLVHGTAQNANTDYQNSIYCEVRPTPNPNWPQCAGFPYVMPKHFGASNAHGAGVADYYGAIERLTPIGRANEDDFTFYGSGWLLVRWAIDNSGVTESDFIRALTSASQTGVDNLAARAGRSFRDLLPDFSLATVLDDRAGFAPRTWLHFPSWDTRAIYQGFNTDFPSFYATPFPLAPRQIAYGTIDVDVPTLRGGTGALFELSGSIQGSQSLSIVGGSGGAAPASLGFTILRVQ